MKIFLPVLFFLLPAIPAHAALYQCPMHPSVTSDAPGKCTICGMDLVEVGTAHAVTSPTEIKLGAASTNVIGVRTAEIMPGSLVKTLRVAGTIEDDETRHRILAARVPGRIETLHVNYVGAEVTAGAPLATIYSPEMLTAQRTYVERLRAGNSAYTASERAAAREHLLELGLTDAEIVILEHTLEPTAMVNVRAPMSGTVVARGVYEGQYVQTNDRLFEIGDFSTMWFVFEAHESDLAWLALDQAVDVTTPSLPDRVIAARIGFIDPNLDAQTGTARVRVVLANPDHRLLHRELAFGVVHLAKPALLVPRSAVLQNTGAPLVYVEHAPGTYEARRIRLGRIGDAYAEVLAGVAAHEHVVTEAALLIDSQAQLARAAAGEEPPAVAAALPVSLGSASAPTDAHLIALGEAVADAGVALATENLAAYRAQLPSLRSALQAGIDDAPAGDLARFAATLPDRDELKAARRDFEPLSTAVCDLVRARHLAEKQHWHLYECPMTPVLGLGRWISRDATIHNPFFGSAMPDCGDELP
ncbi:MAG TPA: efflux RND transporter periplasmic adaptor subunit [Candidatus Didemnitutus sp.]|nr:efflux RND transporter periplasmic adaptor subunit [Candidatus Didemnitutus sp.]